jgi:pimeloyl-ACP methyl ester carboxylesterase
VSLGRRLARPALRVGGATAALCVLGLILLYAFQRSLLYPAPTPARPVGFTGGELLHVPRPDGPPAVAFHLPAPPGGRTVVFFHGNGEQLADGGALAATLQSAGLGYFGVEYPGYGLAQGKPSEHSILAAARAAVDHLVSGRGVDEKDVVLLGQSLGSGPATALAADGRGRRLALVTPFTSLPDVAAQHFPWLPVRLLLRDRFDNLALAPRVEVPVLIVHGTRDEVVPYLHGRTLAEVFPLARLITVEGGRHNDLYAFPGVRDRLFSFLAE